MNNIIKVIEHKDVRGKTLWYLHIYNDNGEILINIGLKSFNQLQQLLGDTPPTDKKNIKTSKTA